MSCRLSGPRSLLSFTLWPAFNARLAKACARAPAPQLGGRLIDSAAKKLADEFFDKFAAVVGAASKETVSQPVAEVAHAATT
jgi:hypothetical protein